MKAIPGSFFLFSLFIFLLTSTGGLQGDWTQQFPREEIAPRFSKTKEGYLVLHSEQSGTNGHWRNVFPVEGGKIYQFSAWRLAENILHERRSCVVRIKWYGSNGELVKSPHKVNPAYLGKDTDMARPDYPRDWERRKDGAVLVKDTYIAPADATEAQVQLHLRWTDSGKVTWKEVSFVKAKPLPP